MCEKCKHYEEEIRDLNKQLDRAARYENNMKTEIKRLHRVRRELESQLDAKN